MSAFGRCAEVIRERQNGTMGPGKPTGLTAAIERLADAMAEGRSWMDARQAAEFLDLSYDEFTRISSQLPRHPLPEGRGNGLRPRYRYFAPELTEWMLGR